MSTGDQTSCPHCGSPLGPSGRCADCEPAPRSRATQMVPIQPATGGPTRTAEPAGEELARVPLPEGWEIALDVTAGPLQGVNFRVLRSRVLIGRGPVEVALDEDPLVSRRHASLEVYGAVCVLLKDLGSTNGTFVNARRVTACELQDGDEIRVGNTTMVVTIGT